VRSRPALTSTEDDTRHRAPENSDDGHEAGKGGTIESLLRILSALDIGERSEMLVPDARVSPLDPRGKLEPRQHARPSPPDAANDEPWSWAD